MVPSPNDDEVSTFYLMSVKEVEKALLGEKFKPNSALVMIEFLMRHGLLHPDKDPGYGEIQMR